MAATICPRPVTLTFDLLTLKSVWESHVTWGTPVPIFVFLGLLVFELEPMYATSDRRTDGRTTDADDRLMPPLRGGGIITECKNATEKMIDSQVKLLVKLTTVYCYFTSVSGFLNFCTKIITFITNRDYS